MEIKVVIDLSATTQKFLANLTANFAPSMAHATKTIAKASVAAPTEDDEDVAPPPVPTAGKRGRPSKAEMAARKAAEAEAAAPKSKGKAKPVDEDTDDFGDDEESEAEDAEEPSDDEDEESEAEDAEEPSDDEDEEPEDGKLDGSDLTKLKAALRNHSEKKGKQAAVNILRKFAPVSHGVKKADLPKLLKLLKV